MEIPDACYNAGVVVVASRFFMGGNNVKGFQQLRVSEKTPFHKIRVQDIAAGFDLPHPLK